MDREKVIKGLECCAGQCNYHGCPYKDPCENANGVKQIMLDALALLKEQEAVESMNFGDKTDIMANLEGLTWDDWHMYHSDTEVQNIAKSVFDLLIALLKKQKAVAVHDPGAYCPKCGWMLYPEDHPHHCGNCGQAVKWDV